MVAMAARVGAPAKFIRCSQEETCSGLVSSPRAELMLRDSNTCSYFMGLSGIQK